MEDGGGGEGDRAALVGAGLEGAAVPLLGGGGVPDPQVEVGVARARQIEGVGARAKERGRKAILFAPGQGAFPGEAGPVVVRGVVSTVGRAFVGRRFGHEPVVLLTAHEHDLAAVDLFEDALVGARGLGVHEPFQQRKRGAGHAAEEARHGVVTMST